MTRCEYINKEWIVSSTARRIYRIAAALSLGLFLGLLGMQLRGGSPLDIPAAQLLLFVGVVGAATTVVAMEYFLFGFDRSAEWTKACWFLIMLLSLIGLALYF